MLFFINLLGYLLLIYFSVTTFQKYRIQNKKQIHGPTPLPIIGNLNQIRNINKIQFKNMLKKYPKIVRMFIGDYEFISIYDPILIKEIYDKNSDVFNDRPNFPMLKYCKSYLGLGGSCGYIWKENKEVISKSLSKMNLKHIYKVLDDEIDNFINKMMIHCNENKEFNPSENSMELLITILFKYIFNETVNFKDPKIQKLIIKPMMRIFHLFGRGHPGEVFKLLQPFYTLYLKYFETSGYMFDDYIRGIVYNHIKTYNEFGQPRDLIDHLLYEFGYQSDDCIDRIIVNCRDMILGGVETSVNANISFFMFAINYPHIQDKVYDEIKNLVGNERKKVYLSDKPNLPYTVAFIKESLRYRSPTAASVVRVSNKDIVINDEYFIAKNAIITISLNALSMNEEYFPNPDIFDPERFINEPNNPAFLPYTLGPRRCIGMNFANDELFIFVSNIFLNFKIKSINDKKIDETINYGINNNISHKNFNVILEKR